LYLVFAEEVDGARQESDLAANDSDIDDRDIERRLESNAGDNCSTTNTHTHASLLASSRRLQPPQSILLRDAMLAR